MHDGQIGEGHDHVLDPVGVEGHADQAILVAADGVHLLEGAATGPGEVALLVGGEGFGIPVVVEGDAAGVVVQQVGFDKLLPAGTVLDGEVHVLRCAVVEFVAAELGPIAVQRQDGLLGFLEHYGLEVQIGVGIEPSAGAHVLPEVLAHVFALADVAFLAPTLNSNGPGADGDWGLVDRLEVEGCSHPFDAGHEAPHNHVGSMRES